jgi:hypothetical protein
MTNGYIRVPDIKCYPASPWAHSPQHKRTPITPIMRRPPPDVGRRLPLIHLPLLNGDSLDLSDKVFEYRCVKLQQSNIFLLKFQSPWHHRSMRELTLRTDGATSHNPVHTALSACLSSSSSVKAQ